MPLAVAWVNRWTFSSPPPSSPSPSPSHHQLSLRYRKQCGAWVFRCDAILFFTGPPLNKQSQGPFIKCQIFNFKDWVYTQQNMNWTPPPLTVCSRGNSVSLLYNFLGGGGVQSDLFQYSNFLGGVQSKQDRIIWPYGLILKNYARLYKFVHFCSQSCCCGVMEQGLDIHGTMS